MSENERCYNAAQRMGTKEPSLSEQEKWMAQWARAEKALARQKKKELRELTPEKALLAIDALLEIGAKSELSASRKRSSGLVEQQALFQKLQSS